MKDKKIVDWISRLKNKQILISFSVPKTPSQVKRELGIDRFSLRPFLKRKLIKCLNPEQYTGRLHVLTNKARKLLKLSRPVIKKNVDYGLAGWVLRSHRQRHVVLKILAANTTKRHSEEIRKRGSNLNPCLSRVSTKNILNELIGEGLVETEIGGDRRRYYWISEEGMKVSEDVEILCVCP